LKRDLLSKQSLKKEAPPQVKVIHSSHGEEETKELKKRETNEKLEQKSSQEKSRPLNKDSQRGQQPHLEGDAKKKKF